MISARIKQLRSQLNINQSDLADRVGVTQAHISKLELGEREPSHEILGLLAVALETSVSFLIGETDDPSPASEVSQKRGGQRSQALQDLERMIKDLAHENPDIGVLLRSTVENWEDLGEEDIKFISDTLSIALGRVSNELKARMRRESKDGRL